MSNGTRQASTVERLASLAWERIDRDWRDRGNARRSERVAARRADDAEAALRRSVARLKRGGAR